MRYLQKLFNLKSVRLSLIMSYGLLIILPITVCTILYNSFSLKDEIIEKNEYILSQLQASLDQTFSDMHRVSYSVLSNAQVKKYISIKKPSVAETFAITQALENIDEGDFHTFVYSFASDTVIASGLSCDGKMWYQTYSNSSSISFDEWYKKLSSLSSPDYTTLSYNNNDSICYVMPIFDGNSNLGAVITSYPIGDYLKTVSEGDINIYITNTLNNEIVAEYNPLYISSEYVKKNLHYSGSKVIRIDSGRFRTFATPSASTFFCYTSVINEQNLIFIRIFITLILVFCLIICFFLIIKLTNIHYAPLKSLLAQLNGKSNENYSGGFKEFKDIQDAILNIKSDVSDINYNLERNKKLIHEYAFLSILENNFKNVTNFKDANEIFNKTYDLNNYSLILFKVHSYNNLFAEQNSELSDEQLFNYSLFIIKNIYEELLQKYGNVLGVKTGSYYVIMLNMTDEGYEAFKQSCKSTLEEGMDIITSNFNMTFSAVTEYKVCRRMIEIHIMYQQLRSIIDNYTISPEKSIVIDSDNVQAVTSGSEYYYPIEDEQFFMESILNGKYDAAAAVIDNIFKKNLEENRTSPNMLSCLTFDVISTMLKLHKALKAANALPNVNEALMISRLMLCKNAEGLLDEIHTQLDILADSDSTTESIVLKDSVLKYININYNDPNLTLEQISDYINMHYVYVSHTFKQQTGYGISHYINQVRTEKSLHLLYDKALTIAEISTAVGYTSVQTYIRNFKKFYNMSPAQYRLNLQKN